IAANDNWKDTQQAQIQTTGLAPPNNLDAAILITLSPGAYTVFLQGKAMATDIGLGEIYDVDPSANAEAINLSGRGFVGTGNDVLIGGNHHPGAPPKACSVFSSARSALRSAAAESRARWRIRFFRCATPMEMSLPATITGRIHKRQILRRPARHRRTRR